MRAIPNPRPRSSRRVRRGALRPESPVSAAWEEAQALRTQSHGQDFLENMTLKLSPEGGIGTNQEETVFQREESLCAGAGSRAGLQS